MPRRPTHSWQEVTFTLDQPASVRFTVQQPRHRRKGKHGKRFITLKGGFTIAGRAGKNTFHFTGRLHGKRLVPGKYRLVATPKANGEIGKKATAGFAIIP